MTRSRHRHAQGFTLVELMIVVAIIGVLAAIAIPSFVNNQLTSKRSEAFANLSGLARSQITYFTEFGLFIGVLSEPSGQPGDPGPGSTKRSFSGVTGFDLVGWTPEGDVYFDYDTNDANMIGANGCVCPTCFTAAAYGDLDSSGVVSVLVYAHPDATGTIWCNTALLGSSPPLDPNGNRILGQVAQDPTADRF